jgi:hypothetical protein
MFQPKLERSNKGQWSIKIGLEEGILHWHPPLVGRKEDLLTRVLLLPLLEIPMREGLIRVILLSLLKTLRWDGGCFRLLRTPSSTMYLLGIWNLWLATNLECTWLKWPTQLSVSTNKPWATPRVFLKWGRCSVTID